MFSGPEDRNVYSTTTVCSSSRSEIWEDFTPRSNTLEPGDYKHFVPTELRSFFATELRADIP
jgi:hypothetical protein